MTSPTRNLVAIGFSLSLIGSMPGCAAPAQSKTDGRSVADQSNQEGASDQTYPGWAYDQPEYVKPANEPVPEQRVRPNDPLHYFSGERVVMVRQPSGYKADEIPRTALWWTDDNGYHWHKRGYFGRGQSFYPLEVNDDGDYGIRFVGPGQPQGEHAQVYPERVYHVDTKPPEVVVSIAPEQTWYSVGDTVTIAWQARDPHLVEYPVSIGMLTDFSSDEGRMVDLQRDLADEGSFTFVIPEETLEHEVWFRAEAKDRAGNVGCAYSFALQVVETPLATWTTPFTEDADIPADENTAVHGASEVTTAATGISRDEMNAIMKRASAEYEAFLATAAAHIRDVSRRGREAAVKVTVIHGTDTDNAAPKYGREENKTPDETIEPQDSSVEVSRIAEVSAEEPPCDDEVIATDVSAVSLSHALDAGPMSIDEGGLPAITQAARYMEDRSAMSGESGTLEAAAVASVENSSPAVETGGDEPDCEPSVVAIQSSGADTMTPAEDFEVQADGAEQVATASAHDGETADPQIQNPSPDSTHSIRRVAFDPTFGNGLMVPMPATVESASLLDMQDHPWRVLGANEIVTFANACVWALPNRSNHVGQPPEREGRFLADHPALRNIAEPPSWASSFAGGSADVAEPPSDHRP